MSATIGQWVSYQKTPGNSRETGDDLGVFVVHAALLPSGKVLWFSGHAEGVHYLRYAVEWDPLKLVNIADPNSLPDRSFAQMRQHRPPWTIDIFCCHLSHLPDGRILIVGGSTPFEYFGPSRVYNTTTQAYETINVALNQGQTVSRGIRDILIFDPSRAYNSANGDGCIEKVGELVEARWYPTLVTMPDGNILVFSGWTDERVTGAGSPIAETVELIEVNKIDQRKPFYTPKVINILTPDTLTLQGAAHNRFLPLYPGMQLSFNGNVYSMGPTWRHEYFVKDGVSPTNVAQTDYFARRFPSSLEVDVKKRVGKWKIIESVLTTGEEGTCILLHPTSEGKILVLGGNTMLARHTRNAAGSYPPLQGVYDDSKKARILDTSVSPEVFTDLPDMHFARINVNTVLLPDETVLIIGGHDDYKWNVAGHVECEIYNPYYLEDTNYITDPNYLTNATYLANPSAYLNNPANYHPFKVVASMTDPRTYHSAALLLADGTVIVAGGVNPAQTETVPVPGPVGTTGTITKNQKSSEIYRPPYFFSSSPRSEITHVEGIALETAQGLALKHGQIFTITSPNAATIDSVILMKLGAMTHHTDTEQRSVNVEIISISAPTIECRIPTSELELIPGHYMLWIRTGRLPCLKAAIIQIKQKVDASYGAIGGHEITYSVPTTVSSMYSTRTIVQTFVEGFCVGLSIDGIDVQLTHFPESKSWGAIQLVHGRFHSVLALSHYVIDNDLI